MNASPARLAERWPKRWPLQPIPRAKWARQQPTHAGAKPALIDAAVKRAEARPSGNWFVLAASREVGRDRPFGVTVAGVELVAWRDTEGRITHFVSAMGTTGTIMGVSQYLKEKNENIEIIGAQPEEGSRIPGIRKWPEAYLPKIFDRSRVDRTESVSQAASEAMARRLASVEGIFCGISAAGACEVALRVARQVENATIVFVVCDRGDRYLSTGVFPA